MQRTSPRFDPDTLGDQDRARQERRVVLITVLCVGLGLGAMFWMPWARRGFQDTAGAPMRSSAGRVTRVSYTKYDSDIVPSPYFVNGLKIDGRPFNLRDVSIQQELKKGQRIRFTYREGKSGERYLQSIRPE